MWIRFSEDIQVRLVSQGDDTYECQILVCALLCSLSCILCCDACSPHKQTTENNQMAIENLPDAKGYATSDLFIKHPTKNLWKMFVLFRMLNSYLSTDRFD